MSFLLHFLSVLIRVTLAVNANASDSSEDCFKLVRVHMNRAAFTDPLNSSPLHLIDSGRSLIVNGIEDGTPQRYWKLDTSPLPRAIKDVISRLVSLAYQPDPNRIIHQRGSRAGEYGSFLGLPLFNPSIHSPETYTETALFAAVLKKTYPAQADDQIDQVLFSIGVGERESFDSVSAALNMVSEVIDEFRDGWESTHEITGLVSIHFHPTSDHDPHPFLLPSILSTTDTRKGLPEIIRRLRQHRVEPTRVPFFFGAVSYHHSGYIEAHESEGLVLSEMLDPFSTL